MMKPALTRILRLALASLALPLVTAAQTSAVPNFMNYQAYVTDQDNNPLGDTAPTNYTAIFRLYDAATGGEILWAEQQTVTIFQGNFSVILGNGQVDGANPKPPFAEVFDGPERFLGITVNTGAAPTEFTPRQRILANAYAHRAALAEVALSARTVEGESLSIDGSGRVGIGTDSPVAAVTVRQASVAEKGQLTLIDPNNPASSNAAVNAITAFGSDYGEGATGRIWYLGSASSANQDLVVLNDRPGNLGLGTGGRADDLVIDGDGDVALTGDLTVGGRIEGSLAVDASSPSTNPAPDQFAGEVAFDLKTRAAVGVPGMGAETAVMTLSPGSGADHQVAVNAGGLFWRQGSESAAAWGTWHRLAADTYLPAGRQRIIWSNLSGGTRTLDLTSNLDLASVPSWATGVILKVIVVSNNGSVSPFLGSFRTGGSGSLNFSDEAGAFTSELHYYQNGYTNYNSEWSGGVVKAPLLNAGDGVRRTQIRFRHASNSATPDSSVSSYAALIGYY